MRNNRKVSALFVLLPMLASYGLLWLDVVKKIGSLLIIWF